MPQFMLVLREDPSVYRRISPEEMQRVIERYNAWAGRLAAEGRLVGGHKLADAGGRVLRKNGSTLAVKDGPFGETKEVIGGVFLIKADDLAHASELCADHPHLRGEQTVEIREIDLMGKPEP